MVIWEKEREREWPKLINLYKITYTCTCTTKKFIMNFTRSDTCSHDSWIECSARKADLRLCLSNPAVTCASVAC